MTIKDIYAIGEIREFDNTTTKTLCDGECWTLRKSNLPIGAIRITFTDGHQCERKVLCDELDIIRLVEMILIVIFNLALFYLLISRRHLRGNKSNKFYLNLLFIHVSLCTSGLVCMSLPNRFLKYEVIINNGFLMEMFFSLIISTCDKYIKIQYPYLYENLTTNVTIFIIVTSWILPAAFVILALIFNISQMYCTITSTVVLAVAITVLTTTNMKVHIIAKQLANRDLQKRLKDENNSPIVLKCTYVCVTIVSSFVILWFPFFIHNITSLVGITEANGNNYFTRIVVQIALLNSLFDPVLFVMFKKDIKKEIRKIFRSTGMEQSMASREYLSRDSLVSMKL